MKGEVKKKFAIQNLLLPMSLLVTVCIVTEKTTND